MSMQERALFGLNLRALTELMAGFGQKPYRARQVFEALYEQRVGAVEEITTLSGELRARLLAEEWEVGLPKIVQTAVSVDGTERYLVQMADGETVETVWMPDGDGGFGSGEAEDEPEEVAAGAEVGVGAAPGTKQIPFGKAEQERQGQRQTQVPFGNGKRVGQGQRQTQIAFGNDKEKGRGRLGALADRGYRRATICVSSQVGCAVNCQFCLTAKLGIKRNLTAGEIAGQVVAVLNRHQIQVGQDRINLVFMGMGEPFLNYDEFMDAVRLLVEGVGIPESRMTVSTSGILPAIERFAVEAVRPKLALSLNASNDTVREQVMPITRKWKIGQLLEACRRLPLRTREWVTFEYVLLGGVNDRPEHAREVLALLEGMAAKVNLIVWNPGPGIAYIQPAPEDVARFQRMLIDGGVPTYIRRPRGRDIYAACGQLKRTMAEERTPALVEIGPAAA